MKLKQLILPVAFFAMATHLLATDIDSSFSLKWNNLSWGSGGLIPRVRHGTWLGHMILMMTGLETSLWQAHMLGNFVMEFIITRLTNNDSVDLQWVYTAFMT